MNKCFLLHCLCIGCHFTTFRPGAVKMNFAHTNRYIRGSYIHYSLIYHACCQSAIFSLDYVVCYLQPFAVFPVVSWCTWQLDKRCGISGHNDGFFMPDTNTKHIKGISSSDLHICCCLDTPSLSGDFYCRPTVSPYAANLFWHTSSLWISIVSNKSHKWNCHWTRPHF